MEPRFCRQPDRRHNRRWIITLYRAERRATYFLYDRNRIAISELLSECPDLAGYRLAPMQARRCAIQCNIVNKLGRGMAVFLALHTMEAILTPYMGLMLGFL